MMHWISKLAQRWLVIFLLSGLGLSLSGCAVVLVGAGAAAGAGGYYLYTKHREKYRDCPYCKKGIRKEATVCPYCQHKVEPIKEKPSN